MVAASLMLHGQGEYYPCIDRNLYVKNAIIGNLYELFIYQTRERILSVIDQDLQNPVLAVIAQRP